MMKMDMEGLCLPFAKNDLTKKKGLFFMYVKMRNYIENVGLLVCSKL